MKLKERLSQLLPGWGSTLLSLMLIWALGFTTFSSSIDAIFYDFYSAYLPSSSTQAAKTLLIEVDYDKRDSYSTQLETLANKVLDKGGEQIVFLFSPLLSPDFSKWANSTQKVIVGTRTTRDATSTSGFQIIGDETSSIKQDLTGLVVIDTNNHDIYCTQDTTINHDGKQLPTVEFLAARKTRKHLESNQKYWINFRGGLANLPRISIEDALKGNIVPELVAGRSILIGLKGGNEQVGINFPGGSKFDMASANEYHAFALNTLLNNIEILHVSSWQKLAVLAVFALLFFFAYQSTPVKYMLGLSLVLGLTYGTLCWIFLGFFNIWLPLTEIIAMHIATLAIVLHHKAQIESKKLESMLVETSVKLIDKLLPNSVHTSQEFWAHIIMMVEQMLSLNRVIFLERIPGDNRIKEIISLHCDVNDIDERRRDYERTPYSASLQQNAALEIKQYLRTINEIDERQFMLPLVLRGEVLGFWAFGILSEKLATNNSILLHAESLSEHISLLLYQRKIHQEHEVSEKMKWGRYLADRQFTALTDIQNVIKLQEKRLTSLEHLFTGLTTAAIFYDLFGRVVLINAQMNTLLQTINLNPYTMTGIDLIVALTNVDRDSARNHIQQSVFGKRDISKLISIGKEFPRQYQLSLRAISENRFPEATTGEPLLSDGFLIELVDISGINNSLARTLQLVERLRYHLNNDITALASASSQLKSPNLSLSNKDAALCTIDAKTKSASEMLKKSLGYLSENYFLKTNKCYPINVLESLRKAVEHCQKIAAKRNIIIETQTPDFISFAIATQPQIYNAFRTILKYLLDDTIENDRVEVSVTERDNFIQITLEGYGMGIPQDRMDEFLFGKGEVTSTSFKHLRETLRYVKQWGGNLQVISQVGMGTHFSLTLEAFF